MLQPSSVAVRFLIIAAQIFIICENAMLVSAYQHIDKPTIKPADGLKLQPGDTAKLECLLSDSEVNDGAQISWHKLEKGELRLIENGSRTAISKTTAIDANTNKTQRAVILELSQVENSDDGTYQCNVDDETKKERNNFNRVPVDVGNFIRFSTSMPEKQTMSSGKRCNIFVDYRSNPEHEIYWTKDGSPDRLTPSEKYSISNNTEVPWRRAKLIITKTVAEDTGSYTLHVDNGISLVNYTRNITILSAPTLTMDYQSTRPNEMVSFICTSIGFPEPTIRFGFFPCSAETWANCSRTFDLAMVNQHGQPIDRLKAYETKERYSFPASSPGFVVCHAQNSQGNASMTADLWITDIEMGVAIKLESPETEKTIGDDVRIDCAAPVYNMTAIEFYRDGVLEQKAQKGVLEFENRYENYAYIRRMTLFNVTKVGEEAIECRAFRNNSSMAVGNEIVLEVHEPTKPSIRGGTNPENVDVIIGDYHQLRCEVDGMPQPLVQWFRDGQMISNGTTRLRIRVDTPTDSGDYICTARNKMGTVEKKWTLNVKTIIIRTIWIHLVVSLLIILVLTVILTIGFYYQKKKQVKVLKEAGLAYFEEGNLDQMNPEIPIEEQADLLPYRREFEFPREKLKFGKQLGSGAYGVVLKATARGIKADEEETTVAVKMVRKLTANMVMRALVSELKIMIYMGQHLNVVNLLGAVTKNIAKRDLMIIVEYCHFGNVQNFLHDHRSRFVNQINSETDEIDVTEEADHFFLYDNDSVYNSQSINNVETTNNSSNYTTAPTSNSTAITFINDSYVDMASSSSDVATTDTLLSVQPSGGYATHSSVVVSTPAEQINPTSNSPRHSTRLMTTTDLVCWAFQIAAGMEYLASRRVLHGDLAARNVLVCANNVVKISDFGLSRSLYRNDQYKKTSDDLLPYKWLAPECTTDRVFSTRSDVWSYGILLWELFSLAENPYPGIDNNVLLREKLSLGYRMEKPRYANRYIYRIMMNCWNAQPEARPTFTALKNHFDAMLPEEIRIHYDELNQPYVTVNQEKEQLGDFNHLTSLQSSETTIRTVLPIYANGNADPLLLVGSDNLGYERQESQEDIQILQLQLKPGTLKALDNPSYMVGVTSM